MQQDSDVCWVNKDVESPWVSVEEEVALISKWSEGRVSWSWLKVEKWSGALLCDILSAHRPNTPVLLIFSPHPG